MTFDLDSETVDMICDAFGREQVIETPFGTMIGQSTKEGSSIPYGDYTMEYGGDTVHIIGLGWGFGTLFLVRGDGQDKIQIPYSLTLPIKIEDDDEPEEPTERTLRQVSLEMFA